MNSPEQDTPPKGERKLFYGLFIFPLVIAVGMAILLCAVVFLTSEKETPEHLVASIKSGLKGKRWQKAFELSNELNVHPQAATDALLQEIIYLLDPANQYDEKTRGYMALALGRFRQPEAALALEKALSDESPDVVVYALWSLGSKKRTESSPTIEKLLLSHNDEVRKTAAYVLGAIGNPASTIALQEKLSDSSLDVRWNAALALARMKNASGKTLLREMVDRKLLESEQKLDEIRIESIMINAIKGLVLINDADSATILKSIAKEDRNLRVRQAAIEAIKVLK